MKLKGYKEREGEEKKNKDNFINYFFSVFPIPLKVSVTETFKGFCLV